MPSTDHFKSNKSWHCHDNGWHMMASLKARWGSKWPNLKWFNLIRMPRRSSGFHENTEWPRLLAPGHSIECPCNFKIMVMYSRKEKMIYSIDNPAHCFQEWRTFPLLHFQLVIFVSLGHYSRLLYIWYGQSPLLLHSAPDTAPDIAVVYSDVSCWCDERFTGVATVTKRPPPQRRTLACNTLL